jgi:hypothetical protein
MTATASEDRFQRERRIRSLLLDVLVAIDAMSRGDGGRPPAESWQQLWAVERRIKTELHR